MGRHHVDPSIRTADYRTAKMALPVGTRRNVRLAVPWIAMGQLLRACRATCICGPAPVKASTPDHSTGCGLLTLGLLVCWRMRLRMVSAATNYPGPHHIWPVFLPGSGLANRRGGG